jgi:4-amino-4-deoxy-L-arabinose transferase-like glycosyltransferase
VNAPAPPPASRRFFVALLAIAAVALAIRVAYNVVVDPQVGRLSDASAYHLLGQNLADGRGFIRPFDFQLLDVTRATAEYPPLFPAFLSVLARAGIDSVNGQQLVLTLVGTATVVLTGLVGRRIAGDRAGLVAAGIAAIHPMLVQPDALLMTESLATMLVVLCVLLALRARDTPTLGRFAALGVALGVATLSRAEGLLLALLLVLPVAYAARALPLARRTVLAAVALGALVVVVAPWTIYNARRFDTFIPVSNNIGTVLDGANCDLTYSGAYLGSWRSEFGDNRASSFECFEGFAIEDPDFDEAAAAARARRDGLDYIGDHTSRLPAVALARLARTWGVFRPSQQVNLGVLEGRTREWELLGTWFHWLLLPLAAAGTVLLVRRRAVVWPVLAPIVTVSVVSIATYGSQRFRVGADPMLAVLAGVALVAVAERIASNATAASTRTATSAGARNLTAP